MNLAGDYATACHEVIHQRLTAAIGGTVLAKVENRHDFAWKETLNGQVVMVHRKGATPAAAGAPGSNAGRCGFKPRHAQACSSDKYLFVCCPVL